MNTYRWKIRVDARYSALLTYRWLRGCGLSRRKAWAMIVADPGLAWVAR